MQGLSPRSSHQQRAREGAQWTLRLALAALDPFLENSLRTSPLVGRESVFGPGTASWAEEDMLTTQVIWGSQPLLPPHVTVLSSWLGLEG